MTRKLGPFDVAPIGLGCMSLSHAYGRPPLEADAARVLLQAVERGVTHFDTAALYGFGRNEDLLGRTLASHRDRILLASKCGMTGVDGKRVIDGRPATLKNTCEESLKRLRTDMIDLYYLHRWDKSVPIEESVGALADLKRAGKIRAIGLSEVSAATLRAAHAEHAIAAVQSEFSLFSRNPELGVLDTCAEIGAAFVAFSPLARGFLTGVDIGAFEDGDIRRSMPRFVSPHLEDNRKLVLALREIARELAVTPAQLSLAWLLNRSPIIVPIPGTTRIAHLEDNLSAAGIRLDVETRARLEALLAPVMGARYPPAAEAEIDTETF